MAVTILSIFFFFAIFLTSTEKLKQLYLCYHAARAGQGSTKTVTLGSRGGLINPRPRRRRALLAAEDARELTRAHVHVRGHALDADVFSEVLEDPVLQVVERLDRAGLQREQLADLRVARGPPYEKHEPLRDCEGLAWAEILLDEQQRMALVDRLTGLDRDPPHIAARRALDLVLHLHRVHDQQGLAKLVAALEQRLEQTL